MVATTALLAFTTWIHGTAWYLWILPVAAFALVGRFRDAMNFAACWLIGVLAGAVVTGHPCVYLFEQVKLVFLVFGNGSMSRMLVGEFQPSSGALIYLIAVGFVCLIRHAYSGAWINHRAERVFIALGILGWLGGLQVCRFWNEWGLPAFQLWLAFMIQDILEAIGPKGMTSRRSSFYASWTTGPK